MLEDVGILLSIVIEFSNISLVTWGRVRSQLLILNGFGHSLAYLAVCLESVGQNLKCNLSYLSNRSATFLF
jgi:uncharacterized membrane protein